MLKLITVITAVVAIISCVVVTLDYIDYRQEQIKLDCSMRGGSYNFNTRECYRLPGMLPQ